MATSAFGIVRSHPASTQLFRQGEPADQVYLIHQGVIKLTWNANSGHETIVGLRFPGWFLGTAARVLGAPNATNAVTASSATIEHISGEVFQTLLSSNTEFANRVLKAQSEEVIEQTDVIGERACLSARTRLAHLLHRFLVASEMRSEATERRIVIPLPKKDLAALIGVSPEHLSRLLSELCSERLIELRSQWIVIRDPQWFKSA